jgi:exosortase A
VNALPPASAARRLLRPVIESTFPPQAWLLAALIGVSVLLFHETWASTAALWFGSETYTHGAFVPPLVAWLIWRSRHRLESIEWRASFAGLALVVAVVVFWVAGHVAQVQVAEQLAAALVVPALVLCVAGLRVTRVVIYPLALLVLAVPFGEALIPPLMQFTASFAVGALRLTGFSVYRDGLIFSTTAGDFEVVKACSGIRYLMASVTVGSFGAYFMFKSWRRRLAFIALAVVIPIVGNGLRVYFTVILAHLTSIETAGGFDHLIYGAVFFGVLMLLLLWLGTRFSDDPPPPVQQAEGARRPISRNDILMTALVTAALASGPAWASFALRSSLAAGFEPTLVEGASPWTGPRATVTPWSNDLAPQAAALAGEYVDPEGHAVTLSIFWLRPSDGAQELVSSIRPVIKIEPGVAVNDYRVAPAAGGAPALHSVRLVTVRGAWRVGYAYAVDGHLTTSESVMKVREAWRRVRGLRTNLAVVAFSTPEPDARGDREAVLSAFVAAHRGRLEAALTGGKK